MSVEDLNTCFSLEGRLEFITGEGGFAMARISSQHANALVSTYGGQVLSFTPSHADQDMLFVSDNAYFAPGKAIKGGAPICWPWFGPDPEGLGRANHGIARNRQWEVRNTALLSDGAVEIVLGFSSDANTLDVWPHVFDLEIRITIGSDLEISLMTRNRGDEDFSITQALHTYFNVGDIEDVALRGLAGTVFIDSLADNTIKGQHGVLTIDREVDRVYLGVEKDLEIIDPSLSRVITIKASGSNSAVIWNPWIDKAAAMGDMADDEYTRMVCVETGNLASDEAIVPAGGETRLAARYGVTSIEAIPT